MAIQRNKAPQQKRTSIRRIAGAVGTCLLVAVPPFLTASQVIDRALVYQYGYGHIYDVRAPSPTLQGFQAKDVKMHLEEGSVTFGQIRVESGFIGMLRNSYSLSPNKAVSQFMLTYSDISNPQGYSVFDELGQIGPASASLFEAEGCGEHALWLASELSADMGLRITPSVMKIVVSNEGDSVIRTSSFTTPGAGSATLIETARGIKVRGALFAMPELGQLDRLSVTISDTGFVKARNAYCAKLTNVSVDQFIENHMATVERIFLAEGTKTSDEMLALYRNFAGNGGELKIDLERRHFLNEEPSLGEFLGSFKGKVQLGGQQIAYAFDSVPALDWLAGTEDLTAYQTLLLERSRPPDAATTSNAIASASASAVAELPKTSIPSITGNAKAKTASPAWKPNIRVVQVGPGANDRSPKDASYGELAGAGENMVQIETKMARRHSGRIERYTPSEVRLRVNVRGGFAVYTIKRSDIDKIRITR